MALVIIERRVADIMVLDVIGPMTVRSETHALSAKVRQCLDAGHQQIVLDLRGVPHCDLGGIGALVTSLTYVQGRAGRLILVEVPTVVRHLLATMELLNEFEMSADAPTAATLLGGAAPP